MIDVYIAFHLSSSLPHVLQRTTVPEHSAKLAGTFFSKAEGLNPPKLLIKESIADG